MIKNLQNIKTKTLIEKLKHVYNEIIFFIIPEDKYLLKKQIISVSITLFILIVSLVVTFVNG